MPMASAHTDALTLQQAADELGVHYMTAYRYVRLGLLPAEKVGGCWRIAPDDLAAFGSPSSTTPEDEPDIDVEEALIAGDEPAAWRALERRLVDITDPVDIHLTVLAPAMASIGHRWATGDLTIAAEHRASVVTSRLIARLGTRFVAPGRRRGCVVIGAPPADRHALPAAMFADLLRVQGLEVIDLGADPPAASWVDAVVHAEVDAAVLTCTSSGLAESTREAVAAIRAARPDLVVAVGGRAVPDEATARSLGADVWAADPVEAARAVAVAVA